MAVAVAVAADTPCSDFDGSLRNDVQLAAQVALGEDLCVRTRKAEEEEEEE